MVLDGVNGTVVGITMVGCVWDRFGLAAGTVLFRELKASLETLLGRVPVRGSKGESREGGCYEEL